MVKKTIQFTKDGLKDVKDKIVEHETERVEVLKRLQTAREMGDLSENGAYKSARFELGGIDRELRRLRYMVHFGEVVEIEKSDTVGFGSQVKLDNGMEFTLVSGFESDPKKKKLSARSPLGKAVAGKRAGDKVTVEAPGGETSYKIVEVG